MGSRRQLKPLLLMRVRPSCARIPSASTEAVNVKLPVKHKALLPRDWERRCSMTSTRAWALSPLRLFSRGRVKPAHSPAHSTSSRTILRKPLVVRVSTMSTSGQRCFPQHERMPICTVYLAMVPPLPSGMVERSFCYHLRTRNHSIPDLH